MASHLEATRQPCVFATFRRASRSLSQLYDAALKPSGLRATQFNILQEIRSSRETSVVGITRSMYIDQTTLTRSLALLQRAGLIQPAPQTDRRIKAVRLTGKGTRTLARAERLWASAQKNAVKAIGRKKWTRISARITRLADTLNS